ncbi:hypothetical protein PWT90_10476 [Aphanocladium album]|nr:hypothetical protein PWT90_10476 [Aphanocladium album]
MRLQLLSIVVLAASAAQAEKWANFEVLPDGLFSGVTYANGSTTLISLGSGAAYSFDLDGAEAQPEAAATLLSKRYTACWGTPLDNAGVDEGVRALKGWAGNGHSLASGDNNAYIGYNRRGVVVYYCIDRPHSEGNLDNRDIDYALRNMDHDCGFYKSGYFQWNGTPEIVGKANDNVAICVGR